MKIAVTGSSGLVGTALVSALEKEGHRVVRVVRGGAVGPGEIAWDPINRNIETVAFEGLDAVVHLAGENIASGRWTAARKGRIRESRVLGTRSLAKTLARLGRPPRVFVSASAVGFYGDRGDEILTEPSRPGVGFLADLCREWEAAAEPAAAKGIRVIHARFGMILSARGGALAKILLPFRLGLGGRIGSGRQFMSWISITDAVAALHHLIRQESLRGPVNLVAPEPVTNRDFTKILGKVLRRPTLFPLPAFAARLLLGEMARELLLASQRAIPQKLVVSGFKFCHPSLKEALRDLLAGGRYADDPPVPPTTATRTG